MTPLSKLRFDALAGYSRSPYSPLTAEELRWYQARNEKLLGVVSRDLIDEDYLYTVLARDARNRFRAFDLRVNIPTRADAERQLAIALAALQDLPATAFVQGDEVGPPLDLFTPQVAADQEHAFFRGLRQPGYSPALGLLQALMHYFVDADGNFVQQFQSTGFNSRCWELYLFALLTELGYGLDRTHAAPDFHCRGLTGEFFVEATTVNPADAPPTVDETSKDEYFDHYVPRKFGSALLSKMQHEPRYWELPHVTGFPLVLAVQDFHAPHSMVWSNTGLVEYLYGIKQVEETHADGTVEIVSRRIEQHVWQGRAIPSAFFSHPDTEHISAILANPGGTLTKFNRMGYLAGFGNRPIRMIRAGWCYQRSVIPERFVAHVHEPDYTETWREGVSIYHNPNARVPLPEQTLPGAAHHTARDGRIYASMPAFFPLGSTTAIITTT